MAVKLDSVREQEIIEFLDSNEQYCIDVILAKYINEEIEKMISAKNDFENFEHKVEHVSGDHLSDDVKVVDANPFKDKEKRDYYKYVIVEPVPGKPNNIFVCDSYKMAVDKCVEKYKNGFPKDIKEDGEAALSNVIAICIRKVKYFNA